MPTIAEKWVQEGFEKGIEKGIEQGIEKGIEEGKLEAACKMILRGMDNAAIKDITGLSLPKIEELRKKKRK
jgi:predicted transposase/invertase (TIGR01784 family)